MSLVIFFIVSITIFSSGTIVQIVTKYIRLRLRFSFQLVNKMLSKSNDISLLLPSKFLFK